MYDVMEDLWCEEKIRLECLYGDNCRMKMMIENVWIGSKAKVVCWRAQKEFEMEIISTPQISDSGVCYEFVGVVDKIYYLECLLFISDNRVEVRYKGENYNDWSDCYWYGIKQLKLFDYDDSGWSDNDVMYGMQREEMRENRINGWK